MGTEYRTGAAGGRGGLREKKGRNNGTRPYFDKVFAWLAGISVGETKLRPEARGLEGRNCVPRTRHCLVTVLCDPLPAKELLSFNVDERRSVLCVRCFLGLLEAARMKFQHTELFA